jgi:hypothetical protein
MIKTGKMNINKQILSWHSEREATDGPPEVSRHVAWRMADKHKHGISREIFIHYRKHMQDDLFRSRGITRWKKKDEN